MKGEEEVTRIEREGFEKWFDTLIDGLEDLTPNIALLSVQKEQFDDGVQEYTITFYV